MKIDPLVVIEQALQFYTDRERSGAELSQVIQDNYSKISGLDAKQLKSFSYYIDFFEKEGEHLFLPANVYLKDEADELAELLKSLVED